MVLYVARTFLKQVKNFVSDETSGCFCSAKLAKSCEKIMFKRKFSFLARLFHRTDRTVSDVQDNKGLQGQKGQKGQNEDNRIIVFEATRWCYFFSFFRFQLAKTGNFTVFRHYGLNFRLYYVAGS